MISLMLLCQSVLRYNMSNRSFDLVSNNIVFSSSHLSIVKLPWEIHFIFYWFLIYSVYLINSLFIIYNSSISLFCLIIYSFIIVTLVVNCFCSLNVAFIYSLPLTFHFFLFNYFIIYLFFDLIIVNLLYPLIF